MNFQINRLYIIGVFLLFLWGCSKEVFIDLPKKNGKLVVESEFTNLPSDLTLEEAIAGAIQPKYIPSKFKVKKSTSVLESPSENFSNYILKVFKNNNFLHEASYDETNETYLMFEDEQDYPIPGDLIGFELFDNDSLVLDGESKMPNLVKIDEFDTLIFAYVNSETSTLYAKGSITFTDVVEEDNYYEIFIGRKIISNESVVTSENHYPSLYQQEFFRNESLLFSDKTFNGEQKTIDFFFDVAVVMGNQATVNFQTIYFELRNVSEEYYNFKTSKRRHLLLGQNDLLFGTAEPSEVVSNIKNGYGLFGAFTHDQKGFLIPQRTYNL